MIFEETKLSGAYIIKPKKLEDERGFFMRAFCQLEFSKHLPSANIAQCNMSFNEKKGTFRGMHYQIAPFQEDKIVMCTKGAIFDIIVDLRPQSSTYKQSIGVELSEDNLHMLFIPKSFAHGFLTLKDSSMVFYLMTEFHYPKSARGFRWNDAEFSIDLPSEPVIISERDKNYPDFNNNMILSDDLMSINGS
jgi:dTDP-4-dehydrorhamnose 3,5-epimerase